MVYMLRYVAVRPWLWPFAVYGIIKGFRKRDVQ